MGTEDPSPKKSSKPIDYQQSQNNSFRNRLNTDPIQLQKPDDSEKLQPIRRHSNIRDSDFNIHFSSKNSSDFQNSLTFPQPKGNQEMPTLIERSKSRKLSQQYCSDFKKNYMANDRNTFLNHLADSLNHGTKMPIEEIEKFKEEYIPKYFFDWRLVDDPRTGAKYWKNFGKVYPDKNFEEKMKKLGNKVGASELFYLKRSWFYRYLMNNFARNKSENPLFIINRNNILEDSYNTIKNIVYLF